MAALPFAELNEAREIAGLEQKPWGNINIQASVYGRLAQPVKSASATERKAVGDPRMEWYLRWDAKATASEPAIERAARSAFAEEAEAVKKAISGAGSPADIEREAVAAIDPDAWVAKMTGPITATLATGYAEVQAALVPAKAAPEGVTGLSDPMAVQAALEQVAKLAGEVTQTTKDRIAELVAQGIENGWSPDQVADAIAEHAFGGEVTKTRAVTIARTESVAAMSRGGLLGAKDVRDRLGMTVKKAWLTAGMDARPLHLQAEAAGFVDLESDFGVGAEQPGGFGIAGEDVNCFPGDTLVKAGSVERAYRRVYDGPVVKVTTSEGHVLTGTPNHPVMTDRGWCAIGSLDETYKLAYTVVGDEVGLSDPDVDDMPTSIEQVFEALSSVSVLKRVGTVNMDFHGDVTDSEVEIVGPYSELADASVAEIGEPFSDEQLASSDLREGALSPQRLSVRLGLTDATSTSRDMSGFGKSPAFVWARAAHPGVHGFAHTTPLDTEVEKTPTDGCPADSVPDGYGLLGFPSEIRFSDIVKIETSHYSGHVYNLQTASGTYSANSIVAHNCRCTLVYEAQ